MKWSFYAGFLWLLLTAPCWGQIVVPESVERDTLAVATLSNPIPDGAYLADGGWELIGATSKQKPSSYDDGTTLVFTGTPGEYTVIYDGILLQDVTFQDGQGNSVTIRSYVGRIKERATVKINGENGPDPPDPPTPGGPYKVWFIENPEQRDNLPQAQAALLTSLEYRQRLQALGHKFEQVVTNNLLSNPPERLRAVAAIAAGKPLPGLVLDALDGGSNGELLWFPLPENYEALAAFLDEEH